MDHLAPEGPVYQAGTLSGNPLATAAGLAVLAHLDAAAYRTLEARATNLADGLADALERAGLAVQVPRVTTLCGLFFSAEAVRDEEGARAADARAYAAFFQGMLSRGVFLAPSAFEAVFVSLAHTDADIEATIDAAADAAREVAALTS
jgi:glutamate-1-semialdehyde 2,1-aminomutase